MLNALRTVNAARESGDARAAEAEAQRVKQADPLASVREDHKLYYAVLSKLGKTIENEVEEDLDGLCPPGLFDGE